MAPSDPSQLKSNTNLSRSISLTILDRQSREIPVQSSANDRIELVIPRDPYLVVPPMALQNVTPSNQSAHRQIYNLHFINLTRSKWNENRTVALLIELGFLDVNIGYFVIYRFDQSPQLNSSINQIDGWRFLCPSSELIRSKGR